MKFKKIILLFLSASLFISLAFSSYASDIDFEKWNQCRLFEILEYGKESNSDYNGAFLRTDTQKDINQIHFLIMANLEKLGDESKAGVKIKFNNIGTVKLFCDGSTEYDSNKFFAEVDNVLTDNGANDIWIEFTVGIKSGIPDNLVTEFTLYDTDGVASNTYSIDISEYSEDEMPDPDSGEYPERTSAKSQKESALKTAKVKTTKVKTTKHKTTKYKTTKVKTSKSKSAKESDNEYESDEAVAEIEDFDDVQVNSDKNKLIIICAISAAVFAAGGFAAGIANSKKNNSRGDN